MAIITQSKYNDFQINFIIFVIDDTKSTGQI